VSQNLNTLLAVAAEMRAAGHSWKAVAKAVNRKLHTCQNWPTKFKARWLDLLRAVQARRLEQSAGECHAHLLSLCRNDDPKARAAGLNIFYKAAVPAHAPGGLLAAPPAPPDPPPPATEKPKSSLQLEIERWAEEERVIINRRRAYEGKPPCTDDELLAEWQAHTRRCSTAPACRARGRTPGGTRSTRT
jgi:hypothetical protein